MVGDVIKKIRIERNMSQEDLAKIVGVTTSAIGQYETHARKPSYEVLLKIAEYFNITTDYLLGKSEIELDNEDREIIKTLTKSKNKTKKQLINQIVKEMLKD